MTGTLVNAGAIVLGALIGLLLRRGIPEHVNEAVLKVEGLAIVIIGLNSVIGSSFRVTDEGRLSDSGGLLLLVSLVLGCVAGELLRLDHHINRFGRMVEERSGAEGFARGFVSGTLLFCVGAMAIVGALNDGLRGDSSVLLVKSTLDFTFSIVLASSLGMGVAFSAIPVLLLQGTVALLSGIIAPWISEPLLDSFSMVGYAIVTIIGFNFLCHTNIKTANLLPALIIPVLWNFVQFNFL